MRKSNTWNILGVIIGISLVIVGVVFLVNTPGISDFGFTTSVESASFGGDYYSYQYKATKAAADNISDVAEDIVVLAKNLSVYFGIASLFTGLLVTIHYGKECSLVNFENKGNNTRGNTTEITERQELEKIAQQMNQPDITEDTKDVRNE